MVKKGTNLGVIKTMPCFLKKISVKRTVKALGIQSEDKLYKLLLEYYTDSELHAMSEAQIIEAIKKIYSLHTKELKEEVKLIYI